MALWIPCVITLSHTVAQSSFERSRVRSQAFVYSSSSCSELSCSVYVIPSSSFPKIRLFSTYSSSSISFFVFRYGEPTLYPSKTRYLYPTVGVS
jgi:hypothetical protein